MSEHPRTRENRIRRKARRMGFKLVKSHRRDPDAPDFGFYALTVEAIPDPSGPLFNMATLDDVEAALRDLARAAKGPQLNTRTLTTILPITPNRPRKET